MADVNISKYRASVVRDGSKPASPGFVVSEGQDPVNPPGTNNYVPYTGATANVELGEFGLETGFVTLDTTPTNIPTDQGAIYWDDSRSTAALIMNGTLQHIGQDTFFYVKNSSAYTIPKGTCVRFAGTDGASGHLLILPFTANGAFPSSYFMGVTAEDIANGEFGQVMNFGELSGIDTTGYTAGALLYASSTVAGAFQTTAPLAPNNIVLVAAAVNSKVNGSIVVRPTYGSNINNDEGVKITSPTTGDLLQLQAGGLWENKTLAQVIGSAYVPSTRTITINGTAFDLSANRSWTVGDVRTDGSYSNPSWITALAWSKITGTPTTLSGYGITDAVQTSRTITINGVTQDLSDNRTFNVGTVTSVTATSPLFSSGGATPNITIQQASGSQSGFLSSTDWTTFNNKQNALTNPVTGTGTTNYLPKFTGSTTIGNSALQETNGNLGLGVTPTAWDSGWLGGNTNALEIGQLGSSIAAGAGGLLIGNNYIFNSGTNKYARSFPATYYIQNTAAGQHQWWLAPSGTAGNTITFTQAMTLTNGGNLLVGTTTDNGARLQVSGAGTFTSNLTTNGIFVGRTSNGQAFGVGNGVDTDLGIFVQTNNILFSNSGASSGFSFAIGGSTRFSIISSGNVGIGTTSPATRLMVQDSANTYVAHFSGLNQANGIAIGTNSSNVAVIQGYTRTFSATNNIAMQVDGGSFLINRTTNINDIVYKFIVRNSTDVNLGFGIQGGEASIESFNDAINAGTPLRIYASKLSLGLSGNVLIGTTTDNGAKLQVSGSATISSSVGINTTSPSAPLHIVTPTGVNFQNAIRFEKAGGFGEVNLENYYTSGSNYGFGIDVAGTTMMVVNNLGNVGIGTTSPGVRLVNSGATLASVPTLGAGHIGADAILSANGFYGLYTGVSSEGWVWQQVQRNDANTAVYPLVLQPSGGNVLIGTTTDVGARLHVNGDVRTAAPTGGSAVNWRLGTVRGGTVTPNATVRVEIGGVLVDLDARYV